MFLLYKSSQYHKPASENRPMEIKVKKMKKNKRLTFMNDVNSSFLNRFITLCNKIEGIKTYMNQIAAYYLIRGRRKRI